MVQAGLDKKRDRISKITRVKNAGGVAQAVERLPSKCEATRLKKQILKHKFSPRTWQGVRACQRRVVVKW
jgi:hypothetical protein